MDKKKPPVAQQPPKKPPSAFKNIQQVAKDAVNKLGSSVGRKRSASIGSGLITKDMISSPIPGTVVNMSNSNTRRSTSKATTNVIDKELQMKAVEYIKTYGASKATIEQRYGKDIANSIRTKVYKENSLTPSFSTQGKLSVTDPTTVKKSIIPESTTLVNTVQRPSFYSSDALGALDFYEPDATDYNQSQSNNLEVELIIEDLMNLLESLLLSVFRCNK